MPALGVRKLRQSHTVGGRAWTVPEQSDSRTHPLNHSAIYTEKPSCCFHIFIASITVQSPKFQKKLYNMEMFANFRALDIICFPMRKNILIILITKLSGRRVPNPSNSCTTFHLVLTPWVVITKAHLAICTVTEHSSKKKKNALFSSVM